MPQSLCGCFFAIVNLAIYEDALWPSVDILFYILMPIEFLGLIIVALMEVVELLCRYVYKVDAKANMNRTFDL